MHWKNWTILLKIRKKNSNIIISLNKENHCIYSPTGLPKLRALCIENIVIIVYLSLLYFFFDNYHIVTIIIIMYKSKDMRICLFQNYLQFKYRSINTFSSMSFKYCNNFLQYIISYSHLLWIVIPCPFWSLKSKFLRSCIFSIQLSLQCQ